MLRMVNRWLGRQGLRWRREEEGATAVEFALVSVPFFWLFMGIVELGMVTLFANGLEHGVEHASRLVRTGQVYKQALDQAAFRSAVCSKVMIGSDCNASLMLDVRKFPDFASISALPLPEEDDQGEMTLEEQFQAGGPREVVVVRAFYEWKFFTPMIGRLLSSNGRNSIMLEAATTFRNEPYGS